MTIAAREIAVLGGYSHLAWLLCRELVEPGTKLVLAGRRGDALGRVARDLEVRGAASAGTFELDLAQFDPALVRAAAEALPRLELLIVAYATMNEPDPSRMQRTNVESALAWVRAFAEHVVPGGHIVVFGSVAGDRVRESNRRYGQSKADLARALDAMRASLAERDVSLTLVKPGPTRTRMTRDMRAGALWAEPGAVAAELARRLAGRPPTVYVPSWWRWIMLVIRLIPGPIFRRLPI